MKGNSLLGGTIILVVANFISKIFGAVLKIPLTYILGEEGMAIYHTTFSVYVTALLLVTSGIPFALSKYITKELALRHDGNIRKAINIAIITMVISGFVGSVILYFGAEFFALSMKDPKAVLAIKVISPSVLFVAVGCVYKSIFEAYSNMIPTAISQVSESCFKLILGFTFALWLSAFSVTYSACGAIFSITAGELIATLILYLLYLPYKKELKKTTTKEKSKKVFTALMAVAIPMIFISVISSGLSLMETAVIRNRLLDIEFTKNTACNFFRTYSSFTHVFDNLPDTLMIDIDGARWLFGAYSGYAATVFNLPLGVLASFGVSVVPVITRYSTLNNYSKLNEVLNSVTKILLILSLPCAVIFMSFPEEILSILFKNTASAIMLKTMSPMLVIISISNIISTALYASGKIGIPFFNDTVASVLKIIMSFIFIKIPQINIFGVILSSFMANVLLLIMNLISAKKYLKVKLFSFGFLTKSIVSAGCMTIICRLSKQRATESFLTFILLASFALIVYFILILLFGAVTKKEIKNLHA